MIILLFAFNVVIFLSVLLATSMFRNYLKQISSSIDIFLDPKAYKPESQMAFITSLVDKYRIYNKGERIEKELDSLINSCFYQHKIGVFNATTIDVIARKGKQLLLVSMVSMVIFEMVTIGLGQSTLHSILILSSAGLGLIMIFFQMIKHIDVKQERLFIKIKEYLQHSYPYLKEKQDQEKQELLLQKKINTLENKIEELEQIKIQVLGQSDKETLSSTEEEEGNLIEKDIAQLIHYFVTPNE